MKLLCNLLICIPVLLFAQQNEAPAWEYKVVSDIPFIKPLNNEFIAAAEEMMANKWTQQILNIILVDEETLSQNSSKELFLFQIQNRSAGKTVSIPIGIKMDYVRKIKSGNSAALHQFSEETAEWIMRFI